MTIDRATIKAYHHELDEMLKSWAEKKGLKFEGGNITFDSTEFSYRPKFVACDANGIAKLDFWAERAMEAKCKELNYNGNPLGKTFYTYEGKRFTITGFGDRKYCWEGILHGPRADREVRVTSGYLLNLTKEAA